MAKKSSSSSAAVAVQQSDGLAIQWTERRVRVADLVPYERNPRRITKASFERLKASLKTTGYNTRLMVTPDLRVVAGHQRIQAFKELGITEVAVLVPDRDLTDAEFRQILIQSNLSFGEFDDDILSADFDIEELKDWGAPDWMLSELDKEAPDDFPEVDEQIETEHLCPKCGYAWSGGKETPVAEKAESH